MEREISTLEAAHLVKWGYNELFLLPHLCLAPVRLFINTGFLVLQWNQPYKSSWWRNCWPFWRFKITIRDVNSASLCPLSSQNLTAETVIESKRGWLSNFLPVTRWLPLIPPPPYQGLDAFFNLLTMRYSCTISPLNLWDLHFEVTAIISHSLSNERTASSFVFKSSWLGCWLDFLVCSTLVPGCLVNKPTNAFRITSCQRQ